MNAEPTVFVVDDDEAVRGAVMLLLKSEGLAAEAYASAEAFLDGYRPERPGCLVLDISMPGMSGLELQQTLAAKQLRIPIIFMTGHGDVPMSVRALKAGAMDFIEKPFSNETLLKAVRSAIALDLQIREQEAKRIADAAQAYAERMVETVRQPLLVLDASLRIISANRSFYDTFRVEPGQVASMPLHEFEDLHEALPSLRESLEAVASQDSELNNLEFVHEFSAIGRRNMLLSAHRLRQSPDQPRRVLVAIEDITERKDAEERLRLAQKIFTDTAEAILITDHEMRIIDMNQAFCAMSGYARDELVGETPRILSSGRHDAKFYGDLWQSLKDTGHWQGEIWDRRKNGQTYPNWTSISAVKDDDGNVRHYVAVYTDITPMKETEERLERLAHFDQLTGLANRMLFHDRLRAALARAHRHRNGMAIMYVDLDGFKSVNDTLGHKVGDDLLVQAAGCIKRCVREEDTVARLGGDEFAVILHELDSTDSLRSMAERMVDKLAMSVKFGERELRLSGSIGLAVYPTDGRDEETLLRHADQAMYHAKGQGKNTYQFFDPAMNLRAVSRIHMESDLRAAVENGQLFVEYQPKVDLQSDRVVGFEALVRWYHPEQGILLPANFIPLAEESGLIIPLGKFVLEEACAEARNWCDTGKTEIPVAVNLSARQFRHVSLVEDIQQILEKTGLSARLLEVEITESLVMEDIERSISILRQLKEMGVKISIDDFGTGYSSLSYLKKLPVDALKIDCAFVADIPANPDDKAIVSAIISMAHSLKLRVTAEGVENADQLDFLNAENCNEIQGFLISASVSPNKVNDLISDYLGAWNSA